MKKSKKEILTEKKTMERMIIIYCNAHHNSNKGELCSHCTVLKEYSTKRIDNCIYGVNKPSCKKCPVHCYNNINRKYIREVMKYSGPRMIFNYPILVIKHLIKNINPK